MKYKFTDSNNVSDFVRYVVMKLGNCEIQTKSSGEICVEVSTVSSIVDSTTLDKYALKCNGEKQWKWKEIEQ